MWDIDITITLASTPFPFPLVPQTSSQLWVFSRLGGVWSRFRDFSREGLEGLGWDGMGWDGDDDRVLGGWLGLGWGWV